MLGEQCWSNSESGTAWEGRSRQRGNSKLIRSFHTGLLSAPDVTAGFPPWFSGKESACNAGDTGDMGSIPGSGRSPEGHGNPLWYSHLENPMDRGAWWASPMDHRESDMTDGLRKRAWCDKHPLSPRQVKVNKLLLLSDFLMENMATILSELRLSQSTKSSNAGDRGENPMSLWVKKKLSPSLLTTECWKDTLPGVQWSFQTRA